MKLFRDDNTDGYSPEELDALNAEWKEKVNFHQLMEDTEEYDIEAKRFSDEVARR
jgi:hypothetical protein